MFRCGRGTSTIGKHVRHALDHYQTILLAVQQPGRPVKYDEKAIAKARVSIYSSLLPACSPVADTAAAAGGLCCLHLPLFHLRFSNGHWCHCCCEWCAATGGVTAAAVASLAVVSSSSPDTAASAAAAYKTVAASSIAQHLVRWQLVAKEVEKDRSACVQVNLLYSYMRFWVPVGVGCTSSVSSGQWAVGSEQRAVSSEQSASSSG